MSEIRWTFARGADGWWLPRRTPETDANTLHAVETVFLTFRYPEDVRYAVDLWREDCARYGVGYTLSTPAGAIRRIAPDLVELRDQYGQFENVVLDAAEFENILLALAQAMEEDGTRADQNG